MSMFNMRGKTMKWFVCFMFIAFPVQALVPDKENVYDTRSLVLSYPIPEDIKNFVAFIQVAGGNSACFINSHSFRWDYFIHLNLDSCIDLGWLLLDMLPGEIADLSKASTIEVECTFDGRTLIRKFNQWKFTEIVIHEECPGLGARLLDAQF